MCEVMNSLLKNPDPVPLGEMLRHITFVGEGYGCYENFDVRSDTKPLPQDRIDTIGELIQEDLFDYDVYAYWYELEEYNINVLWFWDGDGVLVFRIFKLGEHLRSIVNDDCKKQYTWEELEVGRLPMVSSEK